MYTFAHACCITGMQVDGVYNYIIIDSPYSVYTLLQCKHPNDPTNVELLIHTAKTIGQIQSTGSLAAFNSMYNI